MNIFNKNWSELQTWKPFLLDVKFTRVERFGKKLRWYCFEHHIESKRTSNHLEKIQVINRYNLESKLAISGANKCYIAKCFQIQNGYAKAVIVNWSLSIFNHQKYELLQINWLFDPIRFEQRLRHSFITFCSNFPKETIHK